MMAASLSSGTRESTPLSTSDSFTVSDSSSSFRGLVGFASEFPQPPSLSPALRRMQSAPWLKEINASFDSDNSIWDRVGQATVQPTQDLDLSFPSSIADLAAYSRDTYTASDAMFQRKARELKMVEDGSPLDRLRQESKRAGGDLSWARRHTFKTRTTDDLLEWSHSRHTRGSLEPTRDSTGSLTQAFSDKRDARRNTLSLVGFEAPVLEEKPRTIRKVSSMQSQTPGKPFSEQGAGQRSIQKIKSLRLFPPHSYSKQDISTLAGSRSDLAALAKDEGVTHSKSKKWLTNLRASSSTKLATIGSHESTKAQAPGLSSRKSMDASLTATTLKKRISRRDRTPYPSAVAPDHLIVADRHRSQGDRGSKVLSAMGKGRMRQSHGDSEGPSKSSGPGLSGYGSKSSVNVGLGLAGSGGVGRLDGPFTLRQSQIYRVTADDQDGDNSPTGACSGPNTSVETSTSFMNITPERGVSGRIDRPAIVEQRKDRVKKFIAKASHGFLEWSRGLGAKKGQGHVSTP